METVSTTVPETLASREVLMMQIKTPMIASPDFYNLLNQDINSGLTAGRIKLFPLENHGKTQSYNTLDYDGMRLSTSQIPEQSITSGEFSRGVVDRLFTAEDINRWGGDSGKLKMFANRKIAQRIPETITKFQKYLELKFIQENLLYVAKPTPDGLGMVPYTLSTTDNTQSNFEVFNVLTTQIKNLIGSPVSSYLLQIMNDRVKAILYAGTASNRLTRYANEMLSDFNRNTFDDMLSGCTVSTSEYKIMQHIPGSAIPVIDTATGNPTTPLTFTITNVTFNYQDKLNNCRGGTITISGGAAANGKTLKTGDVLFIKNSSLVKALSAYETTDFMMPIVIGANSTPNIARPDSQITALDHGTWTFAGGSVTVPFCGNFRPKLANGDPMEFSYNENFVMDKTLANQTINSATLVADLTTALKGATLIPLCGYREHVMIYPPKKLWIYPRVVTLPSGIFEAQVMQTAISKVPAYGDMTKVSALPITARFNQLRSNAYHLDIELYCESAGEYDNYNHNLGAIAINFK